MCGIFGFFGDKKPRDVQLKTLETCLKDLEHRGPNASGTWHSDNVFFGHTRLSITDLSMAGHQPMVSDEKNYTIVLNGEIYNHLEIRKKIEKEIGLICWRGDSDTETFLKSIEVYGINKTLQISDGMYAFALYDARANSVYLARDRAGEKPLYYGLLREGGSDVFIFSSDLNSIKKHPNFRCHLSMASIKKYFEFGYICSPFSIYKSIFKVNPGELICIDLSKFSFNTDSVDEFEPDFWVGFKQTKYWMYEDRELTKKNYSKNTSPSNELREILIQSIKSQLMSKVPIGAFLSGGIDSSLIVAIMLKECNAKFEVFTAGYEDKNYDETLYAKKIADYFGVKFNSLLIKRSDIVEVIQSNYIDIYSEPFADESGISTYLICKNAKNKVTVMLGGDGADELFGGYARYLYVEKLWKFRKIIANKVTLTILRSGSSILETLFKISRINEKIEKLFNLSNSNLSFEEFYNEVNHIWKAKEKLLLEKTPSKQVLRISSAWSDKKRQMMAIDFENYLPDDVLCKVDRASMACGLEVRAPFLGKKLLDFSLTLNSKALFQKASSKWLLRDILLNYLPRKFFERPKMGFGVPLEDIFRNELKQYIMNKLSYEAIDNQKILDPVVVSRVLKEHFDEGKNRTRKIWTLLVFEMWLENERSENGNVIVCS